LTEETDLQPGQEAASESGQPSNSQPSASASPDR
jgi:hypothetical protein